MTLIPQKQRIRKTWQTQTFLSSVLNWMVFVSQLKKRWAQTKRKESITGETGARGALISQARPKRRCHELLGGKARHGEAALGCSLSLGAGPSTCRPGSVSDCAQAESKWPSRRNLESGHDTKTYFWDIVIPKLSFQKKDLPQTQLKKEQTMNG